MYLVRVCWAGQQTAVHVSSPWWRTGGVEFKWVSADVSSQLLSDYQEVEIDHPSKSSGGRAEPFEDETLVWISPKTQQINCDLEDIQY